MLGVVALIWAGAEHLPSLLRRARVAWVQSRVAGFEYPADTVIYDSDPATMEKLLEKWPEDYVKVTDTSVWPTVAVIRKEPAAWSDLKKVMFSGRTFWPPGPAAPKALVHRLVNSAGDERLVAVILAPAPPVSVDGPAGTPQLVMVSALVSGAEWGREPVWRGNGSLLEGAFLKAARLRVYAAKLDPADPSRFTIRYEADKVAGVVEGRLGGDRDVGWR